MINSGVFLAMLLPLKTLGALLLAEMHTSHSSLKYSLYLSLIANITFTENRLQGKHSSANDIDSALNAIKVIVLSVG